MQEWLNKLKIAIAEEDIESIGKLFAAGFGGGVDGAKFVRNASADGVGGADKFARNAGADELAKSTMQGVSTDELVQAANLASEALKLVEREKNAIAQTINKIKTAKEFFRA